MALLSRDAILTADDRDYEEVDCPEWGGTVRIGTISGADRDRFETELARLNQAKSKDTNVRARLVARCAVDEKGARIFSDDDATKLGMKSAKALDRCFDVAAALNGLSEKDAAQLEADFGHAQSEPSTTA